MRSKDSAITESPAGAAPAAQSRLEPELLYRQSPPAVYPQPCTASPHRKSPSVQDPADGGSYPFHPRDHFVTDADIGEGATHHHLMVTATGTIGVKVAPGNPMLLQIAACRTIGFDAPAGEMWSVVTESPSMARIRAPRISLPAAARRPSRQRTATSEYRSSPPASQVIIASTLIAFHSSVPENTSAYPLRNISVETCSTARGNLLPLGRYLSDRPARHSCPSQRLVGGRYSCSPPAQRRPPTAARPASWFSPADEYALRSYGYRRALPDGQIAFFDRFFDRFRQWTGPIQVVQPYPTRLKPSWSR